MARKPLHKKAGKAGKKAKPKRRKKRVRRVVQVSPEHDQHRGASVTYQLERVYCGRCPRLHGPYWYAYWTEARKTRSMYIGRTWRPAAEVAAEQRQRAAAANAKQETAL